MAGEWNELPLSEAVLLNPTTPLKRGTVYPFVEMSAISAGTRDVKCSEHREFPGGGSRFKDRDTLMARITPCLENGKIARFHAPVGALKCRHARRDVWFDCGDSRVDSDRGSAVVCGRYVSPEQAAVERHWQLGRGNDNPFPARYNVTPQQGNPRAYVPVIRHGANGTPERAMLQWWLLPYWSKEPRIKFSTFNARTDKVSSAASFRVPFRKRRCLIPTLGWFEWQATPQGKVKWWLHRRDRDIVSFAGLWDRWHRGDEVIESCTIIVGEANNAVRHIHDRMPVIIEPKDEAFWLDTKIDTVPALEALLQPASEDAITAHTVRSEKRPSDEDATLIDPVV